MIQLELERFNFINDNDLSIECVKWSGRHT